MNIRFSEWLRDIVSPRWRGREWIEHHLGRKASVKDVIESFGVPHTQAGAIEVNGELRDFFYHVAEPDRIEVHPLQPPVQVLLPSLLRPNPLQSVGFVVDVNVGKLAGLLRMAGLDALYDQAMEDDELAELAARQGRILLSRDKALLKRRKLTYGYLVRELQPEKQLVEVVELFGLRESLKPFCRCMTCNGLLQPVAKESVLHSLEPLTKKYYDEFHRCGSCDKIYWAGSHKERMLVLIGRLQKGKPPGIPSRGCGSR